MEEAQVKKEICSIFFVCIMIIPCFRTFVMFSQFYISYFCIYLFSLIVYIILYIYKWTPTPMFYLKLYIAAVVD